MGALSPLALAAILLLPIVQVQASAPAEAAARRMLRPERLAPGKKDPAQKRDYFDPRQYSTKDFPRLVQGFVAQLGTDVARAKRQMGEQTQQLERLQQRVAELEATKQPLTPHAKCSADMLLVLLVALGVVLCANVLLLMQVLKRGRRGAESGGKHVQFENETAMGDSEADLV